MGITHFDEFAYGIRDENSRQHNQYNFDDHLSSTANLYKTEVVNATILHYQIIIILT